MAGVLDIDLGLKIWFMSFADWLWSVIAMAFWLKMILNVLDTNSTHTGITYAHFCCTTHQCLHGLCTPCRVRCEKQHLNNWSAFDG